MSTSTNSGSTLFSFSVFTTTSGTIPITSTVTIPILFNASDSLSFSTTSITSTSTGNFGAGTVAPAQTGPASSQTTSPTATTPAAFASPNSLSTFYPLQSPYIDFTFGTTLRISEFATPSAPATPSYLPALADGSLLTPLYIHDARNAAVVLLSAAVFCVVFLRNIAVAYRYVRHIDARDMTLFYLLLFSQIWGPVACIALLIPLLSSSANCTAVNAIVAASAEISYSVLVSGILGIKAYRCLNRSRAVLAAICVTQVTAWILAAFDLPHLGSARSLANVCVFEHDLRLLPTAFILSSIETLVFVSMCFGYAVWNASKRSANLGRLSLDLSSASPAPPLRGWWDYAPSQRPSASVARSNTSSTVAHSSHTTAAHSQHTTSSTARGAWAILPQRRGSDGWEKVHDDEPADAPKFARVVLLSDAVRNELFYTALILACHVPAMIMVPVALRSARVWPPVFWLGLSWTVTSVLVIQSFAPVVARHARESELRAPGPLALALDAPSGPPRPKQTPWGRAVSFSTNSVFSSSTSPVGLSRRPSTATASLWAVGVANPFAESNTAQSPEAEVWRRGSVSGMSMASSVSRPAQGGLRQVPSAYTSPGHTFASIPPVPELRTVERKGSAESLLLR